MEIDEYLDSMILSLNKKEEALKKLLLYTDEQTKLISAEKFDADKFLYYIGEKGEVIKLINVLDDGFNSTFKIIEKEVKDRPGKYNAKIREMQAEIKKLTELGVKLEAKERRNQPNLDNALKKSKEKIRTYNVSQKAVANYYKSMSIDNDGFQFVGKKKK